MLFYFDHVGLRLRQMPFQRATDPAAEVRLQHGVRIFFEKKSFGIRQIRSSRALLQIREDLFLQFPFQRRFDFSDRPERDAFHFRNRLCLPFSQEIEIRNHFLIRCQRIILPRIESFAYYDEEKRQCGILIDGDYGEHHWMPVGVEDWGNVREFMDAFPNRSFWFETVFSEKRRMVNILNFGLIQRRKKTDSVQNRNEQGTCTASSMSPNGSAGSLGGTPNTPEADT